MEIADHIAHLARDGGLLADAAVRAGGDARVPTCPEWSVRDLVLHIGEVHRWAAATLVDTSGSPGGEEDLAAQMALAPADFEDLVAWFLDGHAALVATLTDADPAANTWHFLPAPSGTAFWARRQAHETAMHRVDAERAAGPVTPFDPAFAVDGLDELLIAFMGRPGGRLRSEQPRDLAIRTTDTGDGWRVQIGPEGRVVTRDGAQDDTAAAGCTVSGPAADLYVALWNRAPLGSLTVDGDRSVLDLWRDKATIRWGG